MAENILFDFDGTLCNTGDGVKAAFCEALKAFGIEVADKAELDRIMGPQLSYSFREFYGLSEKDAKSAVEIYRKIYKSQLLDSSMLYDGMEDMLETLVKKGKKLFIASSKPVEFINRILDLRGATKYFYGICGNNLSDDFPSKELVIRHLMESYPFVTNENSVMVGDRKYDILGAKELNLKTIGVLYGYAEDGEFEASGADYTVKTVKELEELLLTI